MTALHHWSSLDNIAEEARSEDDDDSSPRISTYTEVDVTPIAGGTARAINIRRKHASCPNPVAVAVTETEEHEHHHHQEEDRHDDIIIPAASRTEQQNEKGHVLEGIFETITPATTVTSPKPEPDATSNDMDVDGVPPELVDPEAVRCLRRKIDLRVFPILFIVYALLSLDRINISNSPIWGLTEDLKVSENRYKIVIFAYFISYILFEIPSNMIIRRTRPSWYLSGLMFAWGIVNMCMGFVQTYAQLVALRVLLGALEAGVLPGIIYLTSQYYRRYEFQVRFSSFYCSVLAAGAIGGLLAYAIADLDGVYGVRAWRWIFIIEGAGTSFVALVAVFLIVDWPSQCRFLDAEEKALLSRVLAADGTEEARMNTLNKRAWTRILSDWKIWLSGIVFAGTSMTVYSVTFFMPTILADFGWEARDAQVHGLPFYAAAMGAVIGIAWLSDRCHHRYGFIMLCFAVITVGYGLLLAQAHLPRSVNYAALFLISSGGYAATPIALIWLVNNLSGHWKRAVGIGIQVSMGNIIGLVAANVFPGHEKPHYVTGYAVALGITSLGGLAATVLVLALRAENRRRDAGRRDYRLSFTTEELRNLGDDHPSFHFTL